MDFVISRSAVRIRSSAPVFPRENADYQTGMRAHLLFAPHNVVEASTPRRYAIARCLNRRGKLRKNINDLSGTVISTETGSHKSEKFGSNNCAYVQFPAGTDISPLLEGLPNDLCQCPHWGYVIKGRIHIKYGDGTEEHVQAGDIYYWPPGHTAIIEEDAEIVEFSPNEEMNIVLAHLQQKLQ